MGKQRMYVKEGQWFAVPVRDGQYSLALVMRVSTIGTGILSTFFDVVSNSPEELLAQLPIDESVRVFRLRHGHLGFKLKTWVPLQMNQGFRREDWPVPLYKRHGMDHLFLQAVMRLDPETLEPAEIFDYQGKDYERLQTDRLAGSGFVELALNRWLSPNCEDLLMLRS